MRMRRRCRYSGVGQSSDHPFWSPFSSLTVSLISSNSSFTILSPSVAQGKDSGTHDDWFQGWFTISICMNGRQRFQCLVLTVFINAPTRTFSHKPNESQLQHWRQAWHYRRNLPGLVVFHIEGAKGQPRGDNGTKVPHCVANGGAAVLWMNQFCD